MSANFESGVFVNRPAWHGGGVVVEDVPDLGEAMEIAAMNWSVRKERLYTAFGVFSGHYALMRDKPGSESQILGVVGDRYEIFQNKEAFEWMEPFVESGHWKLEAAGSLCKGRKCWGLLKQAEVEVVPGDVLKQYLLFHWGHDGGAPAVFQPTSIRVVCDNTLQASLRQGGTVKVVHSASMPDKVKFVQRLFLESEGAFSKQMEMFRWLLDKTLTVAKMEEIILKLYGPRKDESKISQTFSRKKVEFVRDFVFNEKASGMKELGVAGTGYGFFNALSELNEHYLVGKQANVETNILFGNAFKRNKEALELVLAA